MLAKSSLLLTLLLSLFSYTQVSSDTIFGKPKYVKEYVLFLNNSGPLTFMKGDSEYGHAANMTPRFLRKNMNRSWFETDFCRYINNETHYDKNRNITKEIWYYKSGEIVDDYTYEYDYLGRLIKEHSKDKYSQVTKRYFYQGIDKKPKFKEYISRWGNDPTEKFVKNVEEGNPFMTIKYDSITKVDSVFSVTSKYMKKIGERTYTSANDSIYRKRLIGVKKYDSIFRVIEAKTFSPDDYNLSKVYLSNQTKYQYNEKGNVIKEESFQDDKYRYFFLEKNGKYREEIKEGEIASNSSIEYSYLHDGTIEARTYYYQGKISNQVCFEFKNNLIKKLYYLDTWGMKDNDLKPTIITFKYKFDKHKNWIECIKNVDGKDLYVWKREIQYH